MTEDMIVYSVAYRVRLERGDVRVDAAVTPMAGGRADPDAVMRFVHRYTWQPDSAVTLPRRIVAETVDDIETAFRPETDVDYRLPRGTLARMIAAL